MLAMADTFAQHGRPKRRWLRRIVVALALFAVAFVVIVGPWPARNGTFEGTDYSKATLRRLSVIGITPAQPSALRIGVAELDITPAVGHQLAGYSSQPSKVSTSVFSRLFARALTIDSQDERITLLTADLLMIHPRLAAAVLERTGLNREDIYFTASHTHSGPGMWADSWTEQFAIGDYDDAYFNELATQLASAVTTSRETLVPVEVGVAIARAPHMIRQRTEHVGEMDDRIVAVVFRDVADGPSEPELRAVIVTYAAHATACGRDDLRLSADYPGGLVSRLRELTGAEHVLFAAGAVGDAAPYPPSGTLNCESADEMGAALADLVQPAIAGATFEREVAFDHIRLRVDLPSLRVPLTPRWSTSPIITSFFDEGESHIHVLRLGPIVLAGMPGDFSDGAASPLISWSARFGHVAVPTSFNGDYHGYLVSSREFYGCEKLERRATFARGPFAGEYFAHLAVRIGAQMTGHSPP